jgi:hypothetical protein
VEQGVLVGTRALSPREREHVEQVLKHGARELTRAVRLLAALPAFVALTLLAMGDRMAALPIASAAVVLLLAARFAPKLCPRPDAEAVKVRAVCQLSPGATDIEPRYYLGEHLACVPRTWEHRWPSGERVEAEVCFLRHPTTRQVRTAVLLSMSVISAGR